MGLSICVYEGLDPNGWTRSDFDAIYGPEACYDDPYAITAWNPSSPEYLEPMEPECVYRTTGAYPEYIGIGSYDYWATWQYYLERFISEGGIPSDDYEAFYEFVNYKHVEGVFGGTWCNVFAYVFSAHRDDAIIWASRALESREHISEFMQTYDAFADAFARAANSGAVRFC